MKMLLQKVILEVTEIIGCHSVDVHRVALALVDLLLECLKTAYLHDESFCVTLLMGIKFL